MEISRRDLLKLLGVATLGASVGGLGANAIFSVPHKLFERINTGPHIETWKNSICGMCSGGCGIKVRLIDGIPVKIQGNVLYPINRGAICPAAEAGIEELFNPDRIRTPLKRAGKRGENKWQTISWNEAIDTLAQRLSDLRNQGKPEQLAFITRDTNDLSINLARRFISAFGSPNFICISEAKQSSLPIYMTQGLDVAPAYDFTHSDYVLNFGANLLDDNTTPVHFNQLYADIRNRKSEFETQIIHIDSYLSRTAANSNKWIPIIPGTMAALALGIAYVIINDGTYNKDFVNNQSFGFSDWKDSSGVEHQGFKSFVLKNNYPENISKITGVPAGEIVDLARKFASAKSPFAIIGGQVTNATNSLYTAWTIYCLNALKGNIGKSGGIVFPYKVKEASVPEIVLDSTALDGLKKPKIGSAGQLSSQFTVDSVDRILPAVLDKQPYPLDTIIFHRVNPLFESTRQKSFKTALEQAPFIVSCNSIMDETTLYADLVLPDHIFLEKWDVSTSIPSIEFPHFGVQQPVVEPLYDTRSVGDLFLELSKKIGGDIAQSLPWDNSKNYFQIYAKEIFNSGKGTVASEIVAVSWLEYLKKRGWQAFDYTTFEEFWDVLVEKGGWWDPNYLDSQMKNIYANESGKFEFYSHTLEKFVKEYVQKNTTSQFKLTEKGDLILLPHYEPPRYGSKESEFPYHFLTYKLIINSEGRNTHLPLIQELSGLHSRIYSNSWIEINPETAHKLSIIENEEVYIVSPKGRLRAKTKILPTVMPENIMMPFGFGHQAFGQDKKVLGVNPFEIFDEDSDLLCGIASHISTKVKIEKVIV